MPEKTDNKRLCKNMIVKDNNKSVVFHNNYDQNDIWLDCYNCSVDNYPRDIYDNKHVIPETYMSVVDPTGPGFEYYPQARVIGSSVDVDTSCHGNCTRFGQVMHSSDITNTQSIVRVYNDEKLAFLHGCIKQHNEHGVDQIMHNFMGSSSKQENSNSNCIMNITKFSCFTMEIGFLLYTFKVRVGSNSLGFTFGLRIFGGQ